MPIFSKVHSIHAHVREPPLVPVHGDERLLKPSNTRTNSEFETRDTWFADLEDGCTYGPAIADEGARHIDAGGREVLTEEAEIQLQVEPIAPPGVVLSCIGIDCLVFAAVGISVGLESTRETIVGLGVQLLDQFDEMFVAKRFDEIAERTKFAS